MTEDLTGQIFGNWTVLETGNKTLPVFPLVSCACSCGVERCVSFYDLKNGSSKSCGGYAHKVKLDVIGRVFGRLTVLRFSHTKNRSAYFMCSCSCGNVLTVASHSFRRGNTQSCGCLKTEITIQRMTTHGLSGTKAYNRLRIKKYRAILFLLDSDWTNEMEYAFWEYFNCCVICGSTDRLAIDHFIPSF